MYSKKISFSIVFSAVLIALFEQKPVFSQANDDNAQYSTCSNGRFSCGTIANNLGYPFWGSSDRPKYCGSPEFELDCHGNETLTTTLDSIRYRVLAINELRSGLTIAYDDLSTNLCPNDQKNATSNPGSFRYATGTQTLTLFYKCPIASASQIPIGYQFNCSPDEPGSVVNFYLTEAMRSVSLVVPQNCEKIVDVRISNSAAQRLLSRASAISGGGDELRSEINSGFEVEWTASEGMCEGCVDSGGVCGSNNQTEAFACYCKDGLYASSCGSTTDGKSDKSRLSTAAGLSIAGACILGMVIGGLCYYFIQRKKRRAAAMARSVSLSTPPSSKSKTIPSTNFSRTTQSVSSYDTTFSKSDIEKGSTYFGAQIFSYTELEEATNNFDPSRELGEGGFGTVYYGELRDGRTVAVKRLYENNFKRVEQFMNEIEILTQLQHPNLVKLYGCTTRRSRELLLVYEFVSNGTVADHLHGNRRQDSAAGPGLSWHVRLGIAIETAEALAHLHRKDIIHRDVKTNNILLDGKFRVKVADFGLSKLFPTDATHVSTAPQGTPGYVDPEYYQCYQLTTKSDVYSFGVVLVELISSLEAVDTNRHRHDINLANMAVSKVQNHLVNELVDPALWLDDGIRKMAADMAELAFRCLQQERDMRPSMEEVLAALRAIGSQGDHAAPEEPEVVDINSDDVGLLRHLPPPLSPDSGEADKWHTTTTPNAAPYNSY